MNITEIHVDDFGAWHDLTLEELSKGATVFYGPNEAGKTTLLNTIRTVLYGFSEKRCGRYLPPAQGTTAGGRLLASDVSGRFYIHRSAPAHYAGGDGILSIKSTDGSSHGNEFLATLLAGVDETIFNNVFAVGLTQMQQLATLSDTEAAHQLYGLAAGVDRISLYDVSRELDAQRAAILPKETTAQGRFEQLLEKKSQLQKELKALRRDEGHYAKIRTEYRDLQRNIKQREVTKKLLDSKGDWPEIANRVRKHWARSRKINDGLTQLGPVVDIPKSIQSRVSSSLKQIKDRRREWERVRDERRRLKANASKLRGRDTLYRHAAEIEAFSRQRDRILLLETDVRRAKGAVEELQFELQAELEQLGLQSGIDAKKLPALSDDVVNALRGPAREAREARTSVEGLKQVAETCRREAKKLRGELEAAALRFGGEEIGAAYMRGQTLIDSLERRIDLDEHREDLVRRMSEIEDEAKYWQRSSVLPWKGVLTVCAIFSAGATLLMAGVLHERLDLAGTPKTPLMWIGGSLAGISLFIKGAFEGSSRERAEVCQQQLKLLCDEHDLAVEEAAELDSSMPTASGNLDQRLLDAREALGHLNQFLPLQRRHEELEREADATDHQATLAVRHLKEARRVWKASLRSVGLPESLTPANIGDMQGRIGGITRLRRLIAESNTALEDRTQELDTIRQRVDQLLTLGQISDVPTGLDAQLSRLLIELEKHAKSGKQVDEHKRRWEELGKQQNRIADNAKQLLSTRRQLLAAHGLTNSREFRDTQSRGQKAAELRRERNRLLGQISDQLGDEFSVGKLQKMLDARSHALLDHIRKVDEDRQSVGEDLNSLYERSGQLKQRLDGRMQDRRGDHKELALHVLDEQIRRTAQEWQRSAIVTSTLDDIKRNYETKRQPVALAEASRHLERLTEGRYTRIWTPMGKNALCVDDSQSSVLPVEKLSRGTRELVFLSLRLALVSSYQRRGATMPLVLDDVFVNFDDRRARAAAKVLSDLADAGQQVLIFTCHERIREIFSGLNADVRDLPVRNGAAHRVRVQPKVEPSIEPVVEAVVEPTTIEVEPVPVAVAPAPVAPVPVEPIDIDVELPVYDAESWDEAVEQLMTPLANLRASAPNDAPPVDDIWEDEIVPIEERPDQFQSAWRDDWLEPLPDL